MLACDLLSALLLHRRFGIRSSAVYLLVGLPLVPMGLLRLDLLTTTLALVAVTLAWGGGHGTANNNSGSRQVVVGLVVGAAIASAAAIKLWPALILIPLWMLGQRRAATTAAVLGGGLAALWLVWAGVGFEPIDQVLSLRGATGWHVESTGGLITTLAAAFDGEPLQPMLELNAYRVGTISETATSLGRVATVGALLLLSLQARVSVSGNADPAVALAVVMAGTLGLLLASAPLFSPQFVLWLTPWVAMAAATPAEGRPWANPLWLAAAMCILTGAVLAAYGPSGVADPLAASLLLFRNATMAVLPVACWLWLRLMGSQLADDSSSPGFELTDPDIDQVAGETHTFGK